MPDGAAGAGCIVVGAGPAGLFAAETLAEAGVAVRVYDAAASPARKFLLAGRGGLNLTHSEPLAAFMTRYGAGAAPLREAIRAFTPDNLRAWAAGLGEPPFVGSSGRVFPQSFKASPLLRAWLRRLEALGVRLHPRHRFTGFDADGRASFATPAGARVEAADCVILALGGASWPRLGSDGAWVGPLRRAGVAIAGLRPANCGFRVAWSEPFRARFAGQPLKPLALSFGGARVRGEATITRDGIEGGAVYALSARLRDALESGEETALLADLTPDVSPAALEAKLASPRDGQSMANVLRKAARLSPVAAALLRECGPLPAQPAALAARIKAAPIRLLATPPIERAISSAGGVAWSALDEHFMMRALPGVFAAGEMIDWEAPTGGYLLQASFATGRAAALGALSWMAR